MLFMPEEDRPSFPIPDEALALAGPVLASLACNSTDAKGVLAGAGAGALVGFIFSASKLRSLLKEGMGTNFADEKAALRFNTGCLTFFAPIIIGALAGAAEPKIGYSLFGISLIFSLISIERSIFHKQIT